MFWELSMQFQCLCPSEMIQSNFVFIFVHCSFKILHQDQDSTSKQHNFTTKGSFLTKRHSNHMCIFWILQWCSQNQSQQQEMCQFNGFICIVDVEPIKLRNLCKKIKTSCCGNFWCSFNVSTLQKWFQATLCSFLCIVHLEFCIKIKTQLQNSTISQPTALIWQKDIQITCAFSEFCNDVVKTKANSKKCVNSMDSSAL